MENLSISALSPYLSACEGQIVGVAVSGGLDSMVLLHLLAEACTKQGVDLAVIHVNHKLRDDASERDAEFVTEQAAMLGLEAEVLTRDVLRDRQLGQSIEMAAREKRYEAFEQASNMLGFNDLFLAHHADDQAETILMRLIVGTSLPSLQGIREIRSLSSGIRLLRPLLPFSREQLLAFAKNNDIAYREDLSNEDTQFLRNRIRHKLIPALEKDYNAGVKQHLLSIGDEAALLNDFLLPQISQQYREVIVKNEIRKKPFSQCHPFVRRQILVRYVTDCLSVPRVTRERLLELDGFVLNGKTGRFLELGSAITLLNTKNSVRLVRSDQSKSLDEVLTVPQRLEWENHCIKSLMSSLPKQVGADVFLLDKVWLTKDLRWRCREQGDFVVIDKQGHQKKIQDLYVDLKIDRDERAYWPLLSHGKRILWVPQYFRDKTCFPCDTSAEVVQFHYTRSQA